MAFLNKLYSIMQNLKLWNDNNKIISSILIFV